MGVEVDRSYRSHMFVEAIRSWLARPWFFTILAATGLCAAYLLGVLFSWGQAAERSLYSNLGMLPVGLAATFLAWTAAGSQGARRSRMAWRLLSVSFGLFFAGDFVYFVNQNIIGKSPFPSSADLGYLAYYPLMFAALVSLPGRGRAGVRHGRSSAALATLLLAAGAAVAYFYLVPTVEASRDDIGVYALSIGYPIGDLLLIAGLAAHLIRRGAHHIHPSIWVLGAGLLVGLGADVVYGYQGIQGALQAGGLSDAGFMVSWILFGWASYVEFVQAERESREDRVPK